MPNHFSARRALLIAATFFAALSSAQSQSCYYPDGTLATTDRPCNPSSNSASACCAGNAFCLINGLCFSAGLMTRASCTDKTWGSSACPQQCTQNSKSSTIALTPCSSANGANTYVCGLNGTDCSSTSDTFSIKGGDSTIVLRPDQIAILAGSQISSQASSLASVTVTVTPDGGAVFTPGQMAGLGAGVALPLLAMLAAVIILYIREKRKYSSATLMLKLPDETKGYDQFSHKSAQSSTTIQPISPGFRSPGYASPGMPSPGLRSPTGTVHQTPALRSPVTDTFETEPRTSIGSRSGTIHVSMSSPRPLPRNLQTTSWSTRSTGRDSVRSRSTTSPNPQHPMSTFSERHESAKYRTRQQELEAARAGRGQDPSRKDVLVQDYQRSMAKQQYAHATGLNSNPPGTTPPLSSPVPTSPLPTLPHELASPGQAPIIHEMGDGRKSVYQGPAATSGAEEAMPSSSNQ